MMSLLHKLPECCDAEHYLSMGAQCAAFGTCHGPLRPAGAYYWFSIPYRLGVSTDILILLGWGLVLLSAILSWLAFGKLLALDAVAHRVSRQVLKLFLLLVALLAHGIFFFPTLFNALSEPPAISLFLSGIWLFLLASCSPSERREKYLLLVAALCWGLSAWVRAFFLYPVLASLALLVCVQLLNRQRRRYVWVISVALLPIVTQYLVMYKEYGTYGYINEETFSEQSEAHLTAPIVGYDTFLPHHAYAWSPQTCDASYGVWNGLQEKQWNDAWCVISNRLYFYLGTYRGATYSYIERAKLLAPGSSEIIGADQSDWHTDMEYFPDAALAPSEKQTADKLRVKTPGQPHEIRQVVPLEEGKPYTFSVWLWSPVPASTQIGITYGDYTRRVVAYQQVMLGPEPVRYSVTGVVPETTVYNVHIGDILAPGLSSSFGRRVGDYLYVWGAQLEEGNEVTAYQADQSVDSQRIRHWSPGLFALNGLAFCLALAFIAVNFRMFLATGYGVATLAALSLSAAQALLIIPEQRFFIPLMIIAWLMAFALLLQLFCRRRTKVTTAA